MNIDRLRTFCSVAETQSFTRAAAALHMTQPAVSQHVNALERELGVALFHRGQARQVVLTEEGRILYRDARRIVAMVDKAAARVRAAALAASSHLRLGLCYSVNEFFLPHVIQPFLAHHPDAQIELVVTASEAVSRQTKAGALHIGITEGAVGRAPGLSVSPLAPNRLVLVASPRHPLAERACLSLAEMVSTPILSYSPGTGPCQAIVQAFAAHGLKPPPVIMETVSLPAIKAAVKIGLGPAFLSEIAIRGELADGSLTVVPVTGLTIARPLVLLRRRKFASPWAQRFIDYLERRLPSLSLGAPSPAVPMG